MAKLYLSFVCIWIVLEFDANTNACTNSSCQNGICLLGTGGQYSCSCNAGFTGTICDQPVEEMCDCDCAFKERIDKLATVNPKPVEQLVEELQPVVQEIKKNLTVDTKKLSSTIRKKTSATDKRPSAKNVGILGIVLLTFTFLLIVGFDLLTLKKYLASFKSYFVSSRD